MVKDGAAAPHRAAPAQHSRGILEAVEEAHLEERHPALLDADLAFHLGVEGGQEAGVQQDPRVALEHREGFESYGFQAARRGLTGGFGHALSPG